MAKFHMVPVESTVIDAVGYNPNTATFAVRFRRKGSRRMPVYYYKGVPQDRAREVLTAESVGQAFIDKIRDVYVFSRHSGNRVKS